MVADALSCAPIHDMKNEQTNPNSVPVDEEIGFRCMEEIVLWLVAAIIASS